MHQLEQLKCFDTIDARCKHEMKLHSSHFQGASFLIVVSTLKVFFQATSFLTVRKFTCRYALRFLKNTSHIQKPLKKKRTSSSGNNELLFVNSQIQITTACQMTTLSNPGTNQDHSPECTIPSRFLSPKYLYIYNLYSLNWKTLWNKNECGKN